MPVNEAIGMIELTSVGIGHMVEDTMLKSADVRLISARTICSGKFIVIVGGNVAGVEAAVSNGLDAAPDGIIDHLTIANVHPDVFKALGQSIQLTSSASLPSIGIIETFSSASALAAADTAAKAADVQLYRIHVAMAMGGKGFVMLAGNVAACQAAVSAAAEVVKAKGLLVSQVVIPRPQRELFADYI